MPKHTSNLAKKFVSHLNYLEFTRKKMESLHSNNQIVRRDIEQVYRGLFLECFTSFEKMLEQLFLGLLVDPGLTHSYSNINPRVTFKSYVVARDVVFGGRNYIDWLPFNWTENRAKVFFTGGLPFTSLSATSKNILKEIGYIRNAIAHSSHHSKKVFINKVLGNTPLPPRERKVPSYLRSIFRSYPQQTRYENYIIELAQVARQLCN